MPSRKNKWRKLPSGIEFRRDTKRHHDGSRCGHDVLLIRIAGKACALVEPLERMGEQSCATGMERQWARMFPAERRGIARALVVLCDTYTIAENGIGAARAVRQYLQRAA